MQLRGDERARRPLPAAELHVWQASLDLAPDRTAALLRLLSDDEVQRAKRFHFDRDRERFIAGRGQLRLLLADYTGQAPEAIEFAYGEHRKPRLAMGGPWFNLSHSGAVALFAFSAGGELGIDVELENPGFAGERIPEHFFSAAEVRSLRALPAEQQPRAFLECWTRKEAFIKARGDGLSLALDSFTVTLGPREPAALVDTAWSGDEPSRWSLIDLSDPVGGFVAAVATRRRGWRVIRHRIGETPSNFTVSNQEDR